MSAVTSGMSVGGIGSVSNGGMDRGTYPMLASADFLVATPRLMLSLVQCREGQRGDKGASIILTVHDAERLRDILNASIADCLAHHRLAPRKEGEVHGA